MFGIAVVDRDGAPVGPWRLLARDGAHLLDTAALFVGWLWPLWDSRGRTFADLLTRTEVHRREPGPAGARRRVAVVAGAAALIAVAAATLGYIGVYRHDLRVAQAREQIAVAGPKIVEQMLSYDPATLPADFARAQALVTDGYRPQLVAQQQAVQKAGPVVNAYWVTNSAVLTSTENTATMLLLMQGQRGAPPNQRGITATVKVDFAQGRRRLAGGQPDRVGEAEAERRREMSPRKRIEPGAQAAFGDVAPRPRRRPGLAVLVAAAATLVIAAIAVSAAVLVTHQRHYDARRPRRRGDRIRAHLHDALHVAGSVPRQRLCRCRAGPVDRATGRDVQENG